jgi:hypothetical protein
MIAPNHILKRLHLLLVSLCVFTAFRSHAQAPHPLQYSEISVGPEYAVPVGGFRSGNATYSAPGGSYKYGLGGSIKYVYHINNTYGLSLQTGAIRYPSDNKSFSFTSFPFKLGGNFQHRSIFVEPQLGLTFFTGNATAYESGSTTYGLNLGAYLSKKMTLSGNYERWNKGGFGASHIGIRVAYSLYVGSQKVIDSVNREKWAAPSYINPDYRETAYWKKHKTFKTLGWTALGVGVPLTFAGFVAAIAASIGDSHISSNTYYWMLGSGGAITLSSIPFFILSHKYKKMAQKPVY